LTATRELVDNDTAYQVFTLAASAQDVELPALNTAANHVFLIMNDASSSYAATVKTYSGAATVATLAAGKSSLFSADDGTWAQVGVDTTLDAFRNLLINGDFRVNQRAYVSAATLATTVYGHDRWKAGASGGDYSFTQLDSSTVITIASGKTLIQVVEDKNVQGGNYVLSWTGTAQGRYAVDSATPAGAYADSPITITGQTAGTTMSVEFDDGTLSDVQLELADASTDFESFPFDVILARCQRYFQKSYSYATATGTSTTEGSQYYQSHVTVTRSNLVFSPMRAAPTVTTWSTDGTINTIRDASVSSNLASTISYISDSSFRWEVTAGAANHNFSYQYAMDAEL
jgi:hypothetical protein